MKYNVEYSEVYEVLKLAVIDGLEKIQELESQKKYIGTYLDFPEMSYFESGLPNFSFSLFNGGLTDYKYVFGREIPIETMESWTQFWELVPKFPALKRYYGFDNNREFAQESGRRRLANLNIEALIDRYIHISKQTSFDQEIFRSVYLEWERCAFLDELPFDIFVPLIYVTFDFDTLDLGNGIFIEKIPEYVQLARMKNKSHLLSRYENFTGAATHAIVLKNWTISNTFLFQRTSILSSAEAFSSVIEKVDLFLAALRTVTDVETGYNQLVIVPDSWGDLWDAYLPDVEIVSVKAYPEHFESSGWLEKPPIISASDCEKASTIYNTLENNKSNKLPLAARRLNAAYLRRNEDDAILDVAIGLESILASDSRSEIIYRLAVRLASLSVIEKFDEHSPLDIFTLCKKIYDYRSAVAHGEHELDKKRIIKLKNEAEPIPVVTLGLSLLRYVIRVMSLNPDLLDAKKLDEHLLNQFTNPIR